MRRLDNITIHIFEDGVGKPYVIIEDEPYGAVEVKFWADNVEVIDNREK